MDGTRLQAQIDRGYAICASKIGLPFDVYRPSSLLTPIASGNKVLTAFLASFTVSKDTLNYMSYNKPKVPMWTAILDSSQVQIGDWLIGAQGIFFIADKQALQPIPAIQCSGNVSIVRPGYLPGAGPISTLGTVAGGLLYTSGTYSNVALTGGSGTGAQATIVVFGGAVASVTKTAPGIDYAIGDVLSASAANIGGTGSGFSIPVTLTVGPMEQGETSIATSFPVFGYTARDRGRLPAGFPAASETDAATPSMEYYINTRTIGAIQKNDVIIDEVGTRWVIDTPNRTSFGFIVEARIEKP